MSASEYYNSSGTPSTRAAGSSSAIRAEFDLIESGFGKLPDLSGNGSLPVFVNSGATGLEATAVATARTRLGLAIGTNVQAWDADLDAIAALAKTDGNIIVGNGTTWVAESGATARTSLGLAIGTDVQAYDAELAALAGLTSAADKVPYFTGSGTAGVADFSAFGRTLVDDANAATARTTLGAAASGANTDITSLSAPALGAATATTASAGTNTTQVATTAFVATAIASPPLPRSYLTGCTLSNGTDATNDIDIAAGVCRDSTDAANITVASLVKQLDANWAAGTNQGMRNSAAAIANGTYHIYAVSKADGTQDIYAYAGVAGTDPDSSATVAAVITALQAETGGADYLYARRIGSILRESAAIVAFSQSGDEFLRSAAALDMNGASVTTTGGLVTFSVPLGPKVWVMVTANQDTPASERGVVFSSPDQADASPGKAAAPIVQFHATSGGPGFTSQLKRSNTSGQLRARAWTSTCTVYASTDGWIDRRGRDN